jgi:hypothetical protein
MKKVRVGVIGIGWFGEMHIFAYKGVPNVEVAALCTRTKSRLEEMAAKYDVKRPIQIIMTFSMILKSMLFQFAHMLLIIWNPCLQQSNPESIFCLKSRWHLRWPNATK